MRTERAHLAAFVALASLLAASAGADAPRARPAPTPAYVEECGSCHLPYPPRFLGPRSWEALMAKLPDHFGVDASLDPARAQELRAFLRAGARQRETLVDGKPVLRIREAGWFRHEHPQPGAAVWRIAEVRSPANCAACHRNAEVGNYGEGSLRVPKAGAPR